MLNSRNLVSLCIGIFLLCAASSAHVILVKWATIDHSSQGPGFTVKLTVDPQGENIKSIIQDPDPSATNVSCPPTQPAALAPANWAASLKVGALVYVKGPATQGDITFTFEVPVPRAPCLTWSLRLQRTDNSELPPVVYTVGARKAMTFGFKQDYPAPAAHPSSNAALVGCGTPDGYRCNAIDGDTSCLEKRYLLCIAKTPNQPIPTIPELQNNWSGGRLGTTTKPYLGFYFTDKAHADQICKNAFNDKWRVAEWHDNPRGQNLGGYGKPREDGRYWVHIKDQNSTCWVE